MPPAMIAANDAVSTFTPVASSVMSTPLACQKRVFDVTY